MTRRIIVTLAPDGSIVSRTAGIAGPSCLDEMGLMMALNEHATLAGSRLTADYQAPTDLPDISIVDSRLEEEA